MMTLLSTIKSLDSKKQSVLGRISFLSLLILCFALLVDIVESNTNNIRSGQAAYPVPREISEKLMIDVISGENINELIRDEKERNNKNKNIVNIIITILVHKKLHYLIIVF